MFVLPLFFFLSFRGAQSASPESIWLLSPTIDGFSDVQLHIKARAAHALE
jgi:hypothetical protein